MNRKNREFLSGAASAPHLLVQPHQSWVTVVSLCLQRMLLLGEADALGGLKCATCEGQCWPGANGPEAATASSHQPGSAFLLYCYFLFL